MQLVDLLRLFEIIAGAILFVLTTVSLAKKRMTESFCIFWGVISVLMILAGIILRPVELNRYISPVGFVIICLGVFCLLMGGYYFSVLISKLIRQVTELAIQISLLNQENEILINEHNDPTKESVIIYSKLYEEKDSVYH